MLLLKRDAKEEGLYKLNRNIINMPSGKKSLPARLPVQLFPRMVENEYQSILINYISELGKIVDNQLVGHLKSLVNQRHIELGQIEKVERADDFADDADRLIAGLKLSFDNIDFNKKTTAEIIGNKVNVWNTKEWNKQLRAAFGVDMIQREPFLTSTLSSFTSANVSLITKMTDDYLANIDGIVSRGLRDGSSSRAIEKELKERLGITKNRARLIARDQVGKLNGQLTELRQTNLGVKEYTWRTSEDERVRPTHIAHNGIVYSWENPPSNTGHPGEDIRCRCYAEPKFDEIAEELGLRTLKEPEPEEDPFKRIASNVAKAAVSLGAAKLTEKVVRSFIVKSFSVKQRRPLLLPATTATISPKNINVINKRFLKMINMYIAKKLTRLSAATFANILTTISASNLTNNIPRILNQNGYTLEESRDIITALEIKTTLEQSI